CAAGNPAAEWSTIASVPGRSAARTAYPSIAELSKGGRSTRAVTASVGTRPSASAIGTRSPGSTRARASTSACASSTVSSSLTRSEYRISMPDELIAGRYRLESLLGRGGMSEVWRAHDQELGRTVAIKLLAAHADQQRFEREARAFAALGHPNITQLYDYGEDAGRPYMVLDDERTAAIAAGIAAGLAHAHARGVVHRDLKPANVLFDEEGRPKLTDYGIARLAAGEGTLTEAGTVLGTAAYISPEQAAGLPATTASDVYSFGIILYRMLTGRLPFESTDPMELVLQHRDATPPPISSLRPDAPARLESTAMAAIAKDPRDRPQDGGALLAELGAPAAGLTTSATAVL